MKKLLAVFLVIAMASVLLAVEAISVKNAESQTFSREGSHNRDFNIIIEEDFENGAEDWTFYDETAPTDWNEEWHISDVGAYQGGNSWWMGDEELGGYTSHRYLVLDTPTLTLAATNPELNFMFSLSCEDIGGDPPYDAWDGANVRISTDGGSTWEPIEGTPAYNGTSFYSFGYEFNEGAGIPGWGSTTDWVTWTAANFDLSSYAGQEVKIRFAFASDPAYDTNDDDSMFGFRVDDIVIDTDSGTFESNGEGVPGDDEMVPGYGGEVAGNLWHLYDDAMAPSPSNAMGCFDESSGTYYPAMSNFVVSPVFNLPEDGIFTWDIYVQTYLDAGTFPDCDYVHVEVRSQPDGGQWTGWNSISNPLGEPGVDNYVFTGAVETWTLFTEGWGMEYADISMLAGRDVQFRFGMHSNATDEVVPGGFRLDSFQVLQEVYLGPAPENLNAQVTVDNEVMLTWDSVSSGGETGWLQWDDGVNNDAIGLTEGGEFYVAASFDQGDLMMYAGGFFTEMEVYINDAPSDMTVYVWEGNMAANEILSQPFTPTPMDWNTITFDTPIEIAAGTEYWIGYSVSHAAAEYPAGTDAGPGIVGKGDWIATTPGSWDSLVGFGLDYNWNIHVYVDSEGRRLPVFSGNRDREVTGYSIYRSAVSGDEYEFVATVDPSDTPSYLDTEPIDGAWNYYVVTALYDGVDGALSNEAAAYVMSAEALEIAYDDGTAEEGYNVGVAQHMAVKFTPEFTEEKMLTHIKIYIHEHDDGQLVLKIFDDNNNPPVSSDFLAQFVVTADNLVEGWNTIEIPENHLPNLHFSDGSFYIAIYEMAGLSAIGKDNDNSGQTWITVANVWEELTTGNVMIRAIIQPAPISNDPQEITPAAVTLSNYPNPFNPVTTIEMNIPVAGQAKLNIFNTKGQLVKTLVDDVLDAGTSFAVWNGTDNNGNAVTSGIYFYQLETQGQTNTRKMIMLK